MSFDAPKMIAGATINCCRLVRSSTSADNTCLQTDLATSVSIGVTADSPRRFDAGTTHALVDEPVTLQEGRSELIIEAGAAVTRGALLISDTVGRVITAIAAANEFVVAKALESAVGAGDKIKCMWIAGYQEETPEV